ncbi:ABC transporter permease, partial [Myxococcota bacterium]|nr:ABC transporter permease [Myxococcota bacterium]
KEGYPASPRVLGAGLAAAGDQSAGVFFRGVDVTADAAVSKVFEKVAHGKWLDKAAKNEVVIGRRLARYLNVQVGAERVVLTQGADGSMANELYQVRGSLGTVSEAVDRAGIYMNAADLRALLVIPEGVHKIVIRKPQSASLAFAIDVIKKITGSNAPRTWKEIVPIMATMLESVEGMIVFMFAIIFIAIGILILNAMLMAVFERIREFGVLKAIGFGPWAVFRLIFVESAIQTFIAASLGLLISVPLLWYLSSHGIRIMGEDESLTFAGMAIDPYWRALVSTNTFMAPLKTMLTIVFIAVLYPALRAAWLRPIKAIYHR